MASRREMHHRSDSKRSVICSLQALLTFATLRVMAGEQESRHAQRMDGYALKGLQQGYGHGTLRPLRFGGTVGYLSEPRANWMRTDGGSGFRRRSAASRPGKALNDILDRYYVEGRHSLGSMLVGLDVGATCGKPAGADFCQRIYQEVVTKEYHRKRNTRLDQSNDGLIAYVWAFRHFECVDRI